MSSIKKKDIKHTITKKDLELNPGLEEDVKVGDEVTIPAEEENEEANKDYRECTCGELVKLPDTPEEVSKCKCGTRHVR